MYSDLPVPFPLQVLASVGGIAWLFFGFKIWTFVADYSVDRDGISVVLFRRFRILRFPYSNIREVKRVDPGEFLRTGEIVTGIGLGNRIFATRVCIRRHRGGTIVITPANAERFLAEVAEKSGASVSTPGE